MGHDDRNTGSTPSGSLPGALGRERRKHYAAPTVADFGPIRRITQAGGQASTNDAFGTGMNMTKYTMIG